jgi:hypothetical protein
VPVRGHDDVARVRRTGHWIRHPMGLITRPPRALQRSLRVGGANAAIRATALLPHMDSLVAALLRIQTGRSSPAY